MWARWGCSSVGKASDRRVADAASIPRCRKGFFSQSQLSVQTLFRCPYTPRVQSHAFTYMRTLKIGNPCQSWVDYGNTKIASMHRRLGRATLSQHAFPMENKPNFPWGKSEWDNTVVKKKKIKIFITYTITTAFFTNTISPDVILCG